MLAEGLTALASLAGNTVAAAATTDAWEAARRKFARLLGRGDPKREQLAEQRLEETREQMNASPRRPMLCISAATSAPGRERL